MKINEVEALVGISKKSIRFYEEEGLLTPKRNSENGYRNYCGEDVETLRKIKALRKLGLPLLYGGTFVMLFIFAAEAFAQYIPSPVSAFLDVPGPALAQQWPVLLAGLLGWCGMNVLAWKISARRFERLDL